jgi:hypothetical protein
MRVKEFKVVEYVLPKFEVFTSQPVFNTIKSGKIIFGVEAKYAYGNPVKGTVTVTVKYSEKPDAIKTYPIDGKRLIEVDLTSVDLLYNMINMGDYRLMGFELTVIEELTGRFLIYLLKHFLDLIIFEISGMTMRSYTGVCVYNKDFKISHVSYRKDFKAGLPFSFYVKITRPDKWMCGKLSNGEPVIDKVNPVKISVSYDNVKLTDLTIMLNAEGMAFVSVTAPLSALRLDFDVNTFILYNMPHAV